MEDFVVTGAKKEHLQGLTSAQIRKIRKPFVERQRRERINGLLDELKELMVNNDNTQDTSKLEKADILEMAVRYLRSRQQQPASGGAVEARFQRGYTECAGEVTRYLHRTASRDVCQRVHQHLQRCLQQPPVSSAPSPPAAALHNNIHNDTMRAAVTSPLSVTSPCSSLSPASSPEASPEVQLTGRFRFQQNANNIHHHPHDNRPVSPVARDENNNVVGPVRPAVFRHRTVWRPW